MDAHQAQDCFGQDNLKGFILELISCLPDKTAYLQAEGDIILGNPSFCDVPSDIHQAHLMQIVSESHAVMVSDVPFRSLALAAKIFPDAF